MKYVIWSFKHNQWWGPDQRGYTSDLSLAGLYGPTEAGEIVINSVLLESCAIIEPIAERHGPPKFHPYNGTEQGKVIA